MTSESVEEYTSKLIERAKVYGKERQDYIEQLILLYAEGMRKKRRKNMLYRLSRFIPIRFTSIYTIHAFGIDECIDHDMRSTWWQWRDRIWSHVCRTV